MPGGRPRVAIKRDEFEKLCGLQCTLAEIAGFFNCSEDTVERWCKRELKVSFADAYKKHSQIGKISLRRYQFRLAEKHPNMAIWLGKQYLNQKDIPDDTTADDPLFEMIDKWNEAAKLEDGADGDDA